MLNDHAPRIHAQQQQAAENTAMEDLEQRSAPLMWAMCVVALLLAADGLYDGWQRYVERSVQYAELATQYAELAAQNEAMIQCINGESMGLGDDVLHCEVIHYKMVAGLSHDL